MNTEKYSPNILEALFKKQKIATFEQIVEALNNPARCTVFRKLNDLEYLSSYSHRGKYYTLRSIAKFSSQGLWRFRSVRFSCFGNLLDTVESFVQQSKAGYSASELQEILGVKTKHALTHLIRSERLQREKMEATFIYFSGKDVAAERQRRARISQMKSSLASVIVANPDLAAEEAKAAVLLFCAMLDEKQRRLYAGLESLKLGHGGDAYIASLLGMDPHTVARGRQELLSNDCNHDHVRATGGGRWPQEKKRRK